MNTPLVALAVSVLCIAARSQAFIVDPNGGGTHISLQAAINAAPAGATIVVRGGTYGPIQVSRSVAILASPLATITQPVFGNGTQPPAIQITGTGSDQVTLANLYVSNVADGGNGWNYCGPAVHSTGLGRLTIEDCTLRGAFWTIVSGSASGASGVVVAGATTVVLQRATIEASLSSTFGGQVPNGAPGVDAPTSTVIALHSQVVGGSCDWYSVPWQPQPAPCPCPGWSGTGGPGIRAATVITAGSSLIAGHGSQVFVNNQPWGNQPSGVPCLGCAPTDMPVALSQAAPLRVGGTQIVLFLPVSPLRFVVSGAPLLPPATVFGIANVFVDTAAPVITQFVGSGTNQLSFAVPNLPSLLGYAIAHQGIEFQTNGIVATNPVLGTIRP